MRNAPFFSACSSLTGPEVTTVENKELLIEDVKHALYCSKICSYAQGMNRASEPSPPAYPSRILITLNSLKDIVILVVYAENVRDRNCFVTCS